MLVLETIFDVQAVKVSQTNSTLQRITIETTEGKVIITCHSTPELSQPITDAP